MKFLSNLENRFSLLIDKAPDIEIERRIRDSIELTGATPWILIFAIFIASIGLNVNSTAVVIGAMLISPLMGPIMGLGFGAGAYDITLIQRGLLNLVISTVIALTVSTLYFLISPLHEIRSELLARTNPTVWDVLIALCGGFAGIIGLSRTEKSNVIPGVAIATALMPPICTAGYGLATSQWLYTAGAFYLYLINCVFIAVATIAGVHLLRIKPHLFPETRFEKLVKRSIWIVIVCTTIPSIYLAFQLVKNEVFTSHAQRFLTQEFIFDSTYLSNYQIDSKSRRIDVTLIGEPLSNQTKALIQAHLIASKIQDAKLFFHETAGGVIGTSSLKSELLKDLYKESQATIAQKETRIEELEALLKEKNSLRDISDQLLDELNALYPSIQSITLANNLSVNKGHATNQFKSILITSRPTLSNQDKVHITNWIKARLPSENIETKFN